MFNNTKAIYGQRAIVLKRCSSAPQVVTSMKNLGRTTEQAIKELELTVVHEELLEGVSGSVPGNRTDIDRIIKRKKERSDFKVLIIQDTSRFTRAGQGHGQKLLYELRAAGILVYFVAEDLLVDNDMAEMYVSFLFSAARHTVKQIAYAATSGSTNSFLTGNSPHCRIPPMGMDRMYTDNGVDRHIIRNLPDGTQHQLHPTTSELIRPFGKNEKKGIPNHYIKQKNEKVRLVPGDPKLIAIVLLIFHLHYIDGMSYRAVAKHLNDANIPSAYGKEWHTGSVRDILLNPIYIGLGIRGRAKKGIYYVAAEGQPEPSQVTLEELANNETVKVVLRPREEWMERVQPHLEDFLPEPVRDIAKVKIEQFLEPIADAKPKTPNRDRHRDHFYLLKGILRSKQGNYLMTGRLSGKKGKEVRKYAVSRGANVPKTDNILTRRIHAQPLEDAVLELVRQVVRSIPDLQTALKELIIQNTETVREETENPQQLQKEIQRKKRQLDVLSDDVDLEDDDVLTRKIATIKADIRALNLRLQKLPQHRRAEKTDVDAIAAKFAKEILDCSDTLGSSNNKQIYRLLDLLISRMEADLETMEVEIDFSIPSWVGSALQRAGAMGLDELSAYKQFIETHPGNGLKIAGFRCDYLRQEGQSCFNCRRFSVAA